MLKLIKIYELIEELKNNHNDVRKTMSDDNISDDDWEYNNGYIHGIGYAIEKLYTLLNIKEYTIRKYLGLINLNDKVDKNKITDYEILSETLNDLTDGNLWAYSIEELDYCIQENKNICIVNLTNGNKALAELPEEML